MFDWIPMDIVDMPGKVILIANDMVPKSSLPELDTPIYIIRFFVIEREIALDTVNNLRKIRLVFPRLHEEMQMIREDNVSQEMERRYYLNHPHGFP